MASTTTHFSVLNVDQIEHSCPVANKGGIGKTARAFRSASDRSSVSVQLNRITEPALVTPYGASFFEGLVKESADVSITVTPAIIAKIREIEAKIKSEAMGNVKGWFGDWSEAKWFQEFLKQKKLTATDPEAQEKMLEKIGEGFTSCIKDDKPLYPPTLSTKLYLSSTEAAAYPELIIKRENAAAKKNKKYVPPNPADEVRRVFYLREVKNRRTGKIEKVWEDAGTWNIEGKSSGYFKLIYDGVWVQATTASWGPKFTIEEALINRQQRKTTLDDGQGNQMKRYNPATDRDVAEDEPEPATDSSSSSSSSSNDVLVITMSGDGGGNVPPSSSSSSSSCLRLSCP
jgi:hypothetical protein